MPIEFTVPFAINSGGGVDTVADPDEQIRQHVLALINTQTGTRVMNSGYGVDVAGLLFEPDDYITSQLLNARVEAAMTAFEPGVIVQSVSRTSDSQDGAQDLEVHYSRRSDPDTQYSSQKTNVASITASGVVTENVRG